MLEAKRTYISAVLMILLGVIALILQSIGGDGEAGESPISPDQAVELIKTAVIVFFGTGLAGLRMKLERMR